MDYCLHAMGSGCRSMRILFFGESPINQTGASRVSKHLLDAIIESGHTVEVIGTNHFVGAEYDHYEYPYFICGINQDTKMQTYDVVQEMIRDRKGTFDLLFLNDDMHVPQLFKELMGDIPTIALGAIDGPVHFREQIDAFQSALVPAVYSRYAYNQVLGVAPDLSSKLACIPLGCEPDVFYPLSQEERRAYRKKAFGIESDEIFLVMIAGRNQIRKDLARGMCAFHQFAQNVPDARMYVLSQRDDIGGNLPAQAALLGCDLKKFYFCGDDYNALAGFSRAKVNCMYNAADVIISTAQGEGWGLCTSEALAAGRPFIGPRNTTFIEMIGEQEERGYLVECGGPELWQMYYGMDNAPRPITSVKGMSSALAYVYENREKAAEKGMIAREWAFIHTWYDFREQWKEVLKRCEYLLQVSMDKTVAI